MALVKDRWGTGIAAAIKALNITSDAAITDSQIEGVWKAMAAESIKELLNADVGPGTFAVTDPQSGSPVPALGKGGPIT